LVAHFVRVAFGNGFRREEVAQVLFLTKEMVSCLIEL
jgi:hypothetical protein